MTNLKRAFDSTLLFIVMVIWLTLYAGPRAFNYFYPPVIEFNIAEIVKDKNALYISGTMYKARCRFAGLNIVGLHVNGTKYHVPVTFLDSDRDNTANRPSGNQQWGPWKLNVDGLTFFTVEASHWCNSFGLPYKWAELGVTTQLLTDFSVPKLKD